MSLDVTQKPAAFRFATEADDGRPVWNPGTGNGYDAHQFAMVWATMIIGWGEITESNAEEWWVRARSYELAMGGTLRVMANDETGKIEDLPLTLDDVKQYIGLQTNVFTGGPGGRGVSYKSTTDAAFTKQLAKVLADTVRRQERDRKRVRAALAAVEA